MESPTLDEAAAHYARQRPPRLRVIKRWRWNTKLLQYGQLFNLTDEEFELLKALAKR